MSGQHARHVLDTYEAAQVYEAARMSTGWSSDKINCDVMSCAIIILSMTGVTGQGRSTSWWACLKHQRQQPMPMTRLP